MPQQVQSGRVKVLYIAGEGRSGSTLLGRLAGEITGAVHVGELYFSLEAGFRGRTLCGCGRRLRECDFWRAVFERGFGGFDGPDTDGFLKTKQSLERVRTLPRLLSPWKSAGDARRLRDYSQALDALYSAVREVSGAGVIVDGSKNVPFSYILAGAPAVDLRLVHLVRDSRAVAFSNRRSKPDPSRYLATGLLRRDKPPRVAASWSLLNLLLMLRPPSRHYLRVRYEDAVQDPAAALASLWSFLDEPPPKTSFLEASPLTLRTGHTVNGNPNRFEAEVDIRPDMEWRHKMPPHDRRLMTALTFPLLLRYGYLHPTPPEVPEENRARIQPAPVL